MIIGELFLKRRGSSAYPNSTVGKLQCKLINLYVSFPVFLEGPLSRSAHILRSKVPEESKLGSCSLVKVRARIKETTAKVMLPNTRLYGFPDPFLSVHRGLKRILSNAASS